jgi:hypothetical protein
VCVLFAGHVELKAGRSRRRRAPHSNKILGIAFSGNFRSAGIANTHVRKSSSITNDGGGGYFPYDRCSAGGTDRFVPKLRRGADVPQKP